MAANVFVSYDHDDQKQVGAFKLLKNNPNHPLDFHDHSLKDPILGSSGQPIKYPPTDAHSKPVRDAIKKKFERASKLIVLIGYDTHRSDWVDWEVKMFYAMKKKISGENTWKRIRGMTLKGCAGTSIPSALGNRSTKVLVWDPDALDKWLSLDPDE
jgi:Thoeris protein ThsB, TIR-like domain